MTVEQFEKNIKTMATAGIILYDTAIECTANKGFKAVPKPSTANFYVTSGYYKMSMTYYADKKDLWGRLDVEVCDGTNYSFDVEFNIETQELNMGLIDSDEMTDEVIEILAILNDYQEEN